MAKFAYISQTNSIDSQVKGYEDKTKTKLNESQIVNTPTVGGKITPTEQVEEKGEVEEEVQVKEKGKDIVERKTEFKNSLLPFLNTYSKDMLKDFFEYWTEHGTNDKKTKFEKQKSFGLQRRLSTWKKNDSKFNNDKKPISKFDQLNNLI